MPQIKIKQRTPRVRVPRHRDGSWQGLAEEYLDDCRRRNCTAATLAVYRSALFGPRTVTFLTDLGIEEVVDFDGPALRRFETELQEAGLSVATVHQYHGTLKTFLGWCEREGVQTDPRLANIHGPRLPTVEPDMYTDAEVRNLRAATRNPRDRMIVEFLSRTGMRLSEVLAVRVDDIIDLGNRGAYVRVQQGKGRKDRHVPLDEDFHRALASYIAKHHSGACHNLFTTRRGTPRPMSKEAFKSLMRRLGDDAGVHCHAHKFRHTFASRAIAEGVDPLTLQRILGHTTLQMVARYVHFGAGDLVDAWRKRPGAKTG